MLRSISPAFVVLLGGWSGAHVLAGSSPVLPPVQPASVGYVTENAVFENGDLRLAGLLMLPEGKAPHPAAVILQGSGDSDRSNAWAFSIAEKLAQSGIAVLLTDKRGCGQSEGDWHTADFDELAEDALAGVDHLRSRDDIDAGRVGVVGLSQGGHVVPVAAARSEYVAFVVDIAGSAVVMEESVAHEVEQNWRKAGGDAEAIRRGLEFYRLANDYARTREDFAAYLQAREKLAVAYGARVVETFPDRTEHWYWDFWQAIVDFDPIPYWKEVHQPVLVVYGELDEEDNVPVARSVRLLQAAFAASGLDDWTIRVLPNTGHALNDPKAATFQLLDEFGELLTTWVHDHTRPE